MPNAEYAIAVERLCKRYGALLAVDNVSFTVERGEVFAFLGPNGAGKSVTVEVIETIRTATSGKVTVLGLDVGKRKAEIVRRIGVLPRISARSTESPCVKACGTTRGYSGAGPTSTP